MNKIKKIIKEQSGISILFFAFSVVTLFAVVALGVDAGNLYLARLRIQKAVDSGSLTALSYRIEHTPQMTNPVSPSTYLCAYDKDGPNPNNYILEDCVKAIIEPLATGSINENLVSMGVKANIPGGADAVVKYFDCREGTKNVGEHATYCVDPRPNPDEEYELFVTDVTYNVPLLLMHKLPFSLTGGSNYGQSSVEMKVSSRAKLPPVTVAMIVDTSESMACPANSPDCSCLNTNSCVGKKVDSLKTALTAFVNNFRPDRDILTLLPFNLQTDPNSVTVTVPCPDAAQPCGPSVALGGGFNKGQLTAKINNLIPKSNTNPADPMLAAYYDLRNNMIIGTEADALKRGTSGQAFYVLFSDGAPTASTIFYNNNPAGNAKNPVVNYEIEWRTAQLQNTNMMIASIDNNFIPVDNSRADSIYAHTTTNWANCDICCTHGLNTLDVDAPPNTHGHPGQYDTQAQSKARCDYNRQQLGLPLCNCFATPTPTPTATAAPTPVGSTAFYGGPSPMIHVELDKPSKVLNPTYGKYFNFVVGSNAPTGDLVTGTPGGPINSTQDTFYASAYGGMAAANFGFKVPDASTTNGYICTSCTHPNEGEYSLPISDDTDFVDRVIDPNGYKKIFYHNFISIADFLRAERGFVFTIGLGPDIGATPGDPYQDINNNEGRKDNLLARVAGDDPRATTDFQFKSPFTSTTCSATNPAGCGNWSNHDTFQGRYGNYTPTTNANELNNIYQAIARKIQLQVVK